MGRPAYCWKLTSIDGKTPVASCGLPIPVDGAFDPTVRQDALILIAAFDAIRCGTPPVLRLLRAGAKRSAIVGGVESGPWLMGMAGLLDGRRATTHWEDLEDFAARFPNVDVQPDRFVVDEPVFTTGGATPALDCRLSLIRARNCYSPALDVASLYIYEEVRAGSDAQPIVSLGRIRKHEPRVAEAIRIMETHIDRPLTIAAIARRVGLSTRALETLFPEGRRRLTWGILCRAPPQRSETPRARHQSSDRRGCRAERLFRHRFPVTGVPAAIRRATVRRAPFETLGAGGRKGQNSIGVHGYYRFGRIPALSRSLCNGKNALEAVIHLPARCARQIELAQIKTLDLRYRVRRRSSRRACQFRCLIC
jgi:putative intracellular protease/amidase